MQNGKRQNTLSLTPYLKDDNKFNLSSDSLVIYVPLL